MVMVMVMTDHRWVLRSDDEDEDEDEDDAAGKKRMKTRRRKIRRNIGRKVRMWGRRSTRTRRARRARARGEAGSTTEVLWRSTSPVATCSSTSRSPRRGGLRTSPRQRQTRASRWRPSTNASTESESETRDQRP